MLGENGFLVVPGPFTGSDLPKTLARIEAAAEAATPGERFVGSSGTNIRIEGLLARAPGMEALFTHAPLLHLARQSIGDRFRLSSFHLRIVMPGAGAQALHRDVAEGCDGWPLVAFIFMIDEFRVENGATRFVSASGQQATIADDHTTHPDAVHACGPAGSMIIFDGSVWHGFGANIGSAPRRSVYGALIPPDAVPASDLAAELPPRTWRALSCRARSILLGTAAER